ncbi:MAG: MFS transporter [Nitrososphaerales archaeon]
MPVTKLAIRNLTLLFGSSMSVLAAVVITPSLPDMTAAFKDIPNAEFLVRMTLTLPALFVAIGAPFFGMLLDKWGRRPVLIGSLFLYGVSGTSGFYLESLTAILVGRALLGLSVAGIMSGFTTLIADYFTGSKLSQFMGYQGAFIGAGGVVFVLLAGVLADVNWRLPFLIYAASLFILPTFLLSVSEPEIKSKVAKAVKSVLPVKTLSLVFAAAFSGMLIFFIFPVQLPFYLTQAGASNTEVGVAFSLQALVAVVTAWQYRRFKARFSFHTIAAFTFLTFGVNHLIVSLSPDFGLVLVGMLLGGIGLGVVPPNLNTWVASVAPPLLRGRAVGLMTTFLFLGQFSAPIFSQPIVAGAGFNFTFVFFGIAALILSIAFLGMTLRQRNEQPSSAVHIS